MRVKHRICIVYVYTNYGYGGHLDGVTLTIYVNFCVLMPRKMSLIDSSGFDFFLCTVLIGFLL